VSVSVSACAAVPTGDPGRLGARPRVKGAAPARPLPCVPSRARRHARRGPGVAGLVPPLAPLTLLALLALLALAAGACGGEGGGAGRTIDGDAGRLHSAPTQVRYAAVQVGAFADSVHAHALRDSLQRDGWTAYLRADDRIAAPGAPRRWLVRVGPSQNLAYAELVAHALRRAGGEALVAQDSGPREAQGVAAFTRVNYGTHGMIARARWALAPDGRSLVVVEDPASVENDPLPNGVFFGSEDGLRWMQLDSVWDAAPAPDWRRLGYGRAWLLAERGRAGAADSLATATWAAVAETLAVPVAAARRAAFRASGMSMLWGIAQPGVAVLDSADGAPPQRVLYPAATGWRVGWDEAGTALLVGAPPEHPRDDSPATRWQRLDLVSGSLRAARAPDTAAGAGGGAAPRWVAGPLLDVTLDADTVRAGPIEVDGGRIVSEGGWIRLGGHRLGPGVALAATRGARYVVALVPDPAAKDGEPKEMLAVYVVSPDSLR